LPKKKDHSENLFILFQFFDLHVLPVGFRGLRLPLDPCGLQLSFFVAFAYHVHPSSISVLNGLEADIRLLKLNFGFGILLPLAFLICITKYLCIRISILTFDMIYSTTLERLRIVNVSGVAFKLFYSGGWLLQEKTIGTRAKNWKSVLRALKFWNFCLHYRSRSMLHAWLHYMIG